MVAFPYYPGFITGGFTDLPVRRIECNAVYLYFILILVLAVYVVWEDVSQDIVYCSVH